MTSVVIAAHNEAAVIERCLRALVGGDASTSFDVTVVANGCTDDTARLAAEFPGIRVIENGIASKAAALNAGDRVALGFPRVYLDADVVVGAEDIHAVCEALQERSILAAVPERHLDLTGRQWPVRAYFSINSRLPVVRTGLFGRGAIGLSEAGRARFDAFPMMMADDLFLDSLFSASEKVEVRGARSLVEPPRTTLDLVNRLVRVRRGNSALRAAAARGEIRTDVRPADRWSWLRDVVLPHPWLAPAAVCYLVITTMAAVRARRVGASSTIWERDQSSRNDRRSDTETP